jgi:hypothetical protein
MTITGCATAGFWIVIASGVVLGQQTDQRGTSAPSLSGESAVIVRTYPDESAPPLRRIETLRESDGQERRIETFESPDLDGRLRPQAETVTNASRVTPTVTRRRSDVFRYIAPGQRTLQYTTESEQEIQPDGNIRTEQNLWTPDSSGALVLTSRQIEHTTSTAPDVKRTDTAVFRRSMDNALRESGRIQQTERQVGPDLFLTETTRSVRDVNGRFQPAEARRLEVQTTGPSQRIEDETVQRLDANGTLSFTERSVTWRSTANGQDQAVTEIYSRNVVRGVMRPDNRVELSRRVRRTTATAPDGGSQTTEEVESRDPVSPNEPLRLVQRTIETVRKMNDQRWRTEQQVFILDVNGRWVLATSETGEQTGR